MSSQKYNNAKCFVLTSNGYEEITYSELCQRANINPQYRTRKFIPLHGMLMEVTPEDYRLFYKTQRRVNYLKEQAIRHKTISFDMLTTDQLSGESVLIAEDDVSQEAINTVLKERLHSCLYLLEPDEYSLIHSIFFESLSERELSQITGIPQRTINDRKRNILKKLRKLMEI